MKMYAYAVLLVVFVVKFSASTNHPTYSSSQYSWATWRRIYGCSDCVCQVKAKVEDKYINTVFEPWFKGAFSKDTFNCSSIPIPEGYPGFYPLCSCIQDTNPVEDCEKQAWKFIGPKNDMVHTKIV